MLKSRRSLNVHISPTPRSLRYLNLVTSLTKACSCRARFCQAEGAKCGQPAGRDNLFNKCANVSNSEQSQEWANGNVRIALLGQLAEKAKRSFGAGMG
jgi:hypothetical protein